MAALHFFFWVEGVFKFSLVRRLDAGLDDRPVVVFSVFSAEGFYVLDFRFLFVDGYFIRDLRIGARGVAPGSFSTEPLLAEVGHSLSRKCENCTQQMRGSVPIAA